MIVSKRPDVDRILKGPPDTIRAVLLYGKAAEDGSNKILVAVCLDPHSAHEADIEVPLHDFGIADGQPFAVSELLGGASHTWNGSRQRIRLTPDDPAAIYRITP